MYILTLRTDNPTAEIGIYNDEKQIALEQWQAHRQLAETLHKKIQNILESAQLQWTDIQGVVCYKGPGSFTGLRIGASVANALAANNNIPIVGTSGENWAHDGIQQLLAGDTQSVIVPEYGMPVHITQARK
jgi:tRNA threonylcarbamoyladenosine biosynthesis protein TsaB